MSNVTSLASRQHLKLDKLEAEVLSLCQKQQALGHRIGLKLLEIADSGEWAAGKTELKVLVGEYQLTNGLTARAGSQLYIYEDVLMFRKGLMIDVGEGGVTLKGISYPEGTRLFVYNTGTLTIIE